MSIGNKTTEQLRTELFTLRRKVSELEALLECEDDYTKTDDYFNQMTEVIPVALCMFSANREHVLYVSRAYETIFGRSCESLYKNPESWLNAVHLEDYNRVLSSIDIRDRYEIRYRITRPDGLIIWVNDRVYTIFDKNNRANCILRFIEDITENKQIEEALSDSFQRSVDIVKAIPSGLFIYQYEPSDKFYLIDENPAAERMTGINIDEWHGSEINDIFTKMKETGLIKQCLIVIETGEIIEINDFDYKDSRFEGNFRVRIFRLPGNQLGMAFENTTELKKSIDREAQAYALGRIEMVDTLLHNIGNAINSVTTGIGTLQENITNNKLTRHISLLAKAIQNNQDKFADYIQHDPQGKMVAPFIIALAEDFAKQDEELTRIVNRVRERAQHIADIIRTEKVISGKGIYRKYISPPKAIEDAVNLLQDSIRKRNIEVVVYCEENLKEICIQESQFHQMLVNLIKNSIEAIDEYNSHIKLPSLENKVPDQEQYNPFIKINIFIEDTNFIIEIADNGIGIEKNKLELIFRPGYTTKDSGSGLGLHSVANFVNGCSGHILAISDGLGKGATMRVILPLSVLS